MKTKFAGLVILIPIIFLLGLNSCKNKDTTTEGGKMFIPSPNLQLYIDSSSELYLQAINEIKQGIDTNTVKDRYVDKIIAMHRMLGNSFDSITQAYMKKEISQEEYDKIRSSLFTDSVSKRSEELSKLGVHIDLR